ncbi:MAG TPA: hypothetical protein DIW47_13315 [Bacteroidetes bacterium]|nr:hypothetical protein [Bacteroidota bacterium]
MKNLILSFLLFSASSVFAQTNFNSWHQFQSKPNGFIMKYPVSWEVNEESFGDYLFHNPYERLGVFRIRVDDRGDSATAEADLLKLKEENSGSSLNTLPDRKILMFKTMSIQNGVTMESHQWVICVDTRLYHCSYTFDNALRNAPNLVEEMKMAYQSVESLNFTSND